MRSVKSYSCYKEYCLVILFTLFTNFLVAGPAVKYTWQGTTSHEWGNSANWSPSGVPGTSDSVVINSNGSNSPELTSDRTVAVFTMTGGSLNYTTKTLTVTGTFSFTGGEMTNGGKLIINGSATATFGTGTNSVKSTVTCNTIFLNGCTFGDSLTITKNGTSNDNSKGNNRFNNYVSLTNTNRGSIVLSDSFPDTFEKIVSIYNKNKDGAIYVAHRGTGNIFRDNITFYGVNIYSNYYGTVSYEGNITINCSGGNLFFGYSSGSATLASGKSLTRGDTAFAAGRLVLRHFTTIGTSTEVNLSLSGTSSLTFDDASTFNGVVTGSAPGLDLRGSRFLKAAYLTKTGTSSNSCYGGCYFGDTVSITLNNSSGVLSLSSTSTDIFNVGAMIQNLNGTLSINNARFNSNVTLKNTNTSTANDRFLVASFGAVTFNGVTTIDNSGSGFITGSAGGTTTVSSGGSLSLKSGFTGNITLKYLTQQGSTAHSFSFPSASSKLFLGPGTTFNGAFSFNGRSVVLNGTTFNSNATILRYGSVPDTCLGGNIFNGTTVIHDSLNSAPMLLAYTSADDFNGNVTFKQNGSGVVLYPSYNKNSTFAGDVTFAGTSTITVGQNGGKAIFDGTSTQNLYSTNGYSPTIKKMQINKSLGTKLKLNQSFSISDSLILSCGRIESDTVNFISMNNGSKLTGGSDSTFIQGPLKKIGNSTFKFPLGASSLGHPYHPLEITAPSSTTDAYTANYFAANQTLGSVSDTSVDNLNECQYWKLNRDAGASKVRLKLTWNHDSCEALLPINMRVVAWNDSMWKDIGNSFSTGDSLLGNITSSDSVESSRYFSIANKKCLAINKSIWHIDVDCHGGSDGQVIVEVKKGTPGYNFIWSGGLISAGNIHNLPAGKFYFSCLDLKGCFLSDSVTISEPPVMSGNFTIDQPSCGDSTGGATIQMAGGVGNYVYYWPASGDSSNTLDSVPAGEYFVVVVDSNNCPFSESIHIDNSDGPGMSILSQINPNCFGQDSGSVRIEGGDTNSPFKYLWSRNINDTLDSLYGLHAGTYSVQITNSLGCISVDTITILQPDTFDVVLTTTGTPCGSSLGQILASPSGGNYPYSYHWSCSADTDSVIVGLAAGIDTVEITDANGCMIKRVTPVMSTSGLSVNADIIHDVICFPDSAGSARVTVSGGTTPYSFIWEPFGGDNDTAIGLLADTYTVVVTDANGCMKSANVTVLSPQQLRTAISSYPPSNDSSFNGTIVANAYGGTPPYHYIWSNLETTNTITQLGVDTFTVLATDANGCKSISTVNFSSVPLLGCLNCHNDQISTCTGIDEIDCYSCSPVVKSIADFGGNGNDESDDECAFERAAYYFSNLDPNVQKTLIIPSGTYYLGNQQTTTSWYLLGASSLCFQNINNLTIIGGGFSHGVKPKLKYRDCMMYGAFQINPVTNQADRFLSDWPGRPVEASISGIYGTLLSGSTAIMSVGDNIYDPDQAHYYYDPITQSNLTWFIPTHIASITSATTFTIDNAPHINTTYRLNLQTGCNVIPNIYTNLASVGDIIHLNGCNNITIRNLELDGNIDNAIIGGGYLIDGIQIDYDGIFMNASNNVSIIDVDIHHFGHDGLWINYNTCPSTPHDDFTRMNCKLTNVKCRFNGRNALTWAGGQGLIAMHCDFSFTGQSRLCSQPGAGMDIEYENSNNYNMDGHFSDCSFRFNKNHGIICDAYNSSNPNSSWDDKAKNFSFSVCKFVGSENGDAAWPNSRNFDFTRGCHFYGTVWNVYGHLASSAADPVINDNTEFDGCFFYEEYLDNDFDAVPPFAGLHYFSRGPEETIINLGSWELYSYPFSCDARHYPICEFTNATGIVMRNCSTVTNISNKLIFLGNGLGPGVYPDYAKSKLSNDYFINHGLNFVASDGNGGCSCDPDLLSIQHTLIQNDCYVPWYEPIRPNLYGLTNPCGIIPWNYRAIPGPTDFFEYSSNPILYGHYYYGNFPIIGLTPPTGKFKDPIDPNTVMPLFASPCSTIAVGYPIQCVASERNQRHILRGIEDIELKATPNPVSDKLDIENIQIGEPYFLTDLAGRIVLKGVSENIKFSLNLTLLKSGTYILYCKNRLPVRIVKI